MEFCKRKFAFTKMKCLMYLLLSVAKPAEAVFLVMLGTNSLPAEKFEKIRQRKKSEKVHLPDHKRGVNEIFLTL
jgi:hypothetical protein